MKTLQEFVIEKLKISKTTKHIHLDLEQLRILFFYIACFLKEDDLRSESSYVNWGEMERYGLYRINFYDEEHEWLNTYGFDEDEKYGDICSRMDELADKCYSFFKELLDWTLDSEDTTNHFIKTFQYIIEYIEKYDTPKIDLYKIDNITKQFNGLKLVYTNYNEFFDNIKKYDKSMLDDINKIYNLAKDLLE